MDVRLCIFVAIAMMSCSILIFLSIIMITLLSIKKQLSMDNFAIMITIFSIILMFSVPFLFKLSEAIPKINKYGNDEDKVKITIYKDTGELLEYDSADHVVIDNNGDTLRFIFNQDSYEITNVKGFQLIKISSNNGD